MIDEVVARRYADAFLAFARETIGLEKGLEELQGVRRVIKDNADFKLFLERPDITEHEKYECINRVLNHDFSETTIDFLQLLIKNNRVNKFLDIAEFARVNYAHGSEVNAVLTTAYPLDTEELKHIKDSLEHRFNKRLHLYIGLDPTLLGGIRVRIGNLVLDGSVQKRLEEMKEKLTTLKVA